jgi:hypothetical protein
MASSSKWARAYWFFIGLLLGIVAICITWLYVEYRLLAGAALHGSVSGRGTTLLEVAFGAVTFFRAILSKHITHSYNHGGLSSVLTNWKLLVGRIVNGSLSGLVAASLIWIPLFCWNLHRGFYLSRNPPNIAINWVRQNGGFLVMPGGPRTISPEYTKYRDQYILTVTRRDHSDTTATVSLTIRLPYAVENYDIPLKANLSEVTFEPVRLSMPVILGGKNVNIYGESLYKNYVLYLKEATKDINLKLVLLVNRDYRPPLIASGKPTPHHKLPELSPQHPRGPFWEYVVLSSTVAYEGVFFNFNAYAPFNVDGEGKISLGEFGFAPSGLSTAVEILPR